MRDEGDRARRLWDAKAGEWDRWIGREGDRNRRLNSDPVLWRMIGDPEGLEVLDAGCGNGYLCVALTERGARVTGVDWSEAQLARARANCDAAGATVTLRRESVDELASLADDAFDLVVSNYVLMDAPNLEGIAAALSRVLRPTGRLVCVFSHPCFGVGLERLEDGRVSYTWDKPYIERWVGEEEWGPFQSPFAFFHRPLTDYVRCFREEGLTLLDLEEPMVPSDCDDVEPELLRRYRMTPFSIALHLRKGRKDPGQN